MLFAAELSVMFIYLLMGFLFESFVLPLSIICTIPLGGIGVAWIHYLTGKDMDFLGLVGAILLIGVVVNNGIVLIDYVIRLRAEGMERAEALVTAAARRVPSHRHDRADNHHRHDPAHVLPAEPAGHQLQELRPHPDRRHDDRHASSPCSSCRSFTRSSTTARLAMSRTVLRMLPKA